MAAVKSRAKRGKPLKDISAKELIKTLAQAAKNNGVSVSETQGARTILVKGDDEYLHLKNRLLDCIDKITCSEIARWH